MLVRKIIDVSFETLFKFKIPDFTVLVFNLTSHIPPSTRCTYNQQTHYAASTSLVVVSHHHFHRPLASRSIVWTVENSHFHIRSTTTSSAKATVGTYHKHTMHPSHCYHRSLPISSKASHRTCSRSFLHQFRIDVVHRTQSAQRGCQSCCTENAVMQFPLQSHLWLEK